MARRGTWGLLWESGSCGAAPPDQRWVQGHLSHLSMHGNSPEPAFLLDSSALQVGGNLGCRGCRAEWAFNEAPGEQGGVL